MSNRNRIGILCGALCLSLFAAGCGRAIRNPAPVPPVQVIDPVIASAQAPTPSPAPQATPEPTAAPPEEIVISLLGDCTLGGDPRIGQLDAFRAVLSENDGDWAYCFSNALAYTGQDDFTLVNLEGPLTDAQGAQDKEFAFKGDASFAKILAAGGVEAVSLSNNHSMDYGEQGYRDTLAALDAQGIAAADAGAPAVFRAKDRTIGVAAGKFPVGDRLHQLESDIRGLKEQGCDIVIAFVHWGGEGDPFPGEDIIKAAHSAVDAGADLVAGHHPHILQGIEVYEGKVIAYSLGNFVFGGNRDPYERETMILQQRFLLTEDGVAPFGFRVLPFLVSGSAGNDYRPVVLAGEEAQRVYRLIDERGALMPSWVEVAEGWIDVE